MSNIQEIKNKKKVLLSSLDSKDSDNVKVNVTGQIERAAQIYHDWQCEGVDGSNYAVPELYRSVKVYNKQLTEEEIKNKVNTIESMGWTLTPSKYIEFIDHDLNIDFEKEMKRIQQEMMEVVETEKKSQRMLESAFEGIGYGIKKD